LPLIGSEKSLRFALLPEGQDPDDLIRLSGPAAMAEHLKDARALADMLFMRETDEQSFDTPEQRAALERRLGEAVGKITDEPLRRHYQADMKRRLSAFLGDERQRPTRNDAGGKRAFAPWRGRSFPPPGPRLGVAEAPLAPQSKFGRKARLPARETMILAIALSHPSLIESHCEELAETEFAGSGLGRFRDALLSAPADALGSSTALAEWLDGAGRGSGREQILELAAKMPNWWCMRPEASASDADQVLRQSLALHRRAGALNRDLKLAERLLATEPNELNLARLLDIKANLADLVDAEAAIDGFGDQSGRISSAI
jgi:DNA primase